VGVCRVAESEGKAICFGDSGRLCALPPIEELFALAFPAISTWRLLRDHMASEGSSWHQVRSEELPSELSNPEDGGDSTNETLSVSGSSKGDRPEKLWIARSYLSIMD
jgi:hypothetical protein